MRCPLRLPRPSLPRRTSWESSTPRTFRAVQRRSARPARGSKIAWDETIAHLGIWITYGAWPQKGGHYEVALEPTNAPSDHVGQTIAGGYPPLAVGERRTWRVTMTATA